MVMGFELGLPVRHWLPSMFPKEHEELKDMDYWDREKAQQIVPERRKGKKC